MASVVCVLLACIAVTVAANGMIVARDVDVARAVAADKMDKSVAAVVDKTQIASLASAT